MKQSTFASTTALRDRTMQQLQQFYEKPIAKVSAELFATLLAVMLLALLAIRPTLLTMSQLLKDIEDRRKTSNALSQKLAALSTLSTEYPTYKKEVDLLDVAVPNTPDFDGFMRRLEKVASEHNLVISSFQIAQVPNEQSDVDTQAPQMTSFAVLVNFKGDYPRVRAVLTELLGMDRYVTLDSLLLNAKRDELEKTNVLFSTANLRVTYYGTPPPTLKKEGQS